LNADIASAGGCGQILEPTGGVLTANATVVLVTSFNLNTAYNSFASLVGTIYMIFQNNPSTIGGNFANYNVTPGVRTLVMSFGGACSETVSYDRSLLINSSGTYGGTVAQNDGATVNYSPLGVPTYINNGCNAPIPPFLVNAGNPQTACKGSTISLSGTAVGQDTLLWTASSGTFSNPTSLSTNYTIDPNASGTSVTLTLTGTKTSPTGCVITRTATVTITFTITNPPTVTSPVNYCPNAVATPLSATPSVGGTLNWYGTNATGGVASTVAPTPSTTTAGTTTYYVSQTIAGCESVRVPILVNVAFSGASLGLFCDLASPNTTPTSMNFDFSNVGQTTFSYSYTITGGPPVTGTWVSPSNYTVTGLTPGTSITFTLSANGVSCVAPMTVTCNTACATITSPNFPAIASICVGGVAPILTNTSPNGVTGTWSPAIINSSTAGTTSYTFSPNSTLFPCATTQVINVTIVNPTTPTFTALGPYCQNAIPANLPTTSSNGFTGIWSPTTISTSAIGTQTYTFTPNAGQCATVTTMSVTVTTPITPTFTALGAYCKNVIPANLPTTSINGFTGNWSPTTISTAAVGTQTYTFTPNAGQCATTTTMSITIIAPTIPTFTNLGPYCQNATPSSLPTTSLNGFTGTWSPAIISTSTVGTQTYTFSPSAGQCAITTTMSVTITAPTLPTFTALGPYCQNTIPVNLSTTSTNGITGTWSPVIISTATVGTQTYTFTPNAGLCATSTTMSVIITMPTTPTFTSLGSYCQNATPNSLPTTSFNGFTGAWSPATISTTTIETQTYTFTPTAGQCAAVTTMTVTITAPIVPTFSSIGPYCQNAVPVNLPTNSSNGFTGTWSPATISTAIVGTQTYIFTPTAGQCATSTTMNITVAAPTLPTFTALGPYCQNAVAATLPSTSTNGFIGTWSPATIATGTVGTQTYTFTPNAGQCATTTTINVTITAPVLATFNAIGPYCQSSTPNNLPIISTNGFQGTWSPSAISTIAIGTQTFTFTTNAGQCAIASSSLQITIIPAPVITTPTDYVVCDDNNDGVSCLFTLGTKDSEISTQPGVQITYHLTLTDSQTNSNAIPKNIPYCNINSAFSQIIYVRVFDPAAPLCASYTTLHLIVNPKPVAHLPNDYHLCDDNTDGIAVFDLSGVVTPQVLGTTLPATDYTVTYYASLANAQAASNAITPASSYASSSGTIWIRVQNNLTGCFDIITVKLFVDPLPTALPFYPQFEVCETVAPLGIETFDLTTQVPSILNGQLGVQVTFYPTLADATANTNAIATPSAYTNTQTYAQTIGIRLTNTTTGCYVISTMDLVVDPKPQPIPPTHPYVVCDTNQDGVAQFDLNTLTPNILFQTPGVYNISYYLTQTDATNTPPTNPIDLTVPYQNINHPFSQFIWVRAENPITHCFNVMQIELVVDPAPIMPTTLATIALCDTDNNTQDGCTTFNLESQTPIILAAQPSAASNYTVTYYTTQAAASSTPAGLSIVGTTSYYACGNPTIWVRIQNNSTGCFAVGSFQLQVNTPMVLTTPTLLSVCDNDANPNDLYTTFDMASFIGIVPNHTIAFFLDSNHTQPINNPSAFVNTIAAVQTVFIVATDTITGCKSYRTLTIQVLPIPTPRTNPPTLPAQCENALNSGVATFDLTTNAPYIINNDANVTLHYYYTQTDMESHTNEIMNPTAVLMGDPALVATHPINYVQYFYIAVTSNAFVGTDGYACYKDVKQGYIVNPLPIVGLLPNNNTYQICQDPANTTGVATFDLTSQNNYLLAGNTTIPTSTYTVAFYTATPPSPASLIPNPAAYTNTSSPNSQDIYVIVTNTITGCTSGVGHFTIVVNPKPTLAVPPPYATCDSDTTNDGYYTYDLSLLTPAILGAAQPNTDYTVSFYNSEYNPAATPPLLPTAIAPSTWTNYQAYTHTVWVVVTNNTTGCQAIDKFNITIEQPPTPVITAPSNVICVDYITHQVVRELTLSINDATVYSPYSPVVGHAYQWYDVSNPTVILGTGSTFTITTPFADNTSASYGVIMTDSTPLACSGTSTAFPVLQSGQAVANPIGSQGYTVTNAFSDNQIITVNAQGYGTYQYSLDDGPQQVSNVFENVSLGTHTITVWDTEGGIANSCDPFTITEVQTIDYPHYFTPNGDGIHDDWNIVGLKNDLSAKIYIFDRYGKLIKQISPQSPGWDGTYNGNLMPSTDYWFTVDYSEAQALKQFKAHFSLKR